MPRLSVTIITLNEERDLPECLRSVSFADDVLVVDAGSSDRTTQIAREMGARVIENPWSGFAAQRAFAMDRAQGDWCLCLDADERVTPELREAIATAITRENVDGYFIRFETRMFGRLLRHGGLGRERHLRLFRKAKARWSEVERADSTDAADAVEIEGVLGELREAIVHVPFASLTEYFDQINRKTSLRALALHRAGQTFSAWCVLRWPLLFARRYLLQLGLIDGWAGFLNAALSAFTDFVARAKLFDLEAHAALLPPADLEAMAALEAHAAAPDPKEDTPAAESEGARDSSRSAESAALPSEKKGAA